MNKDLFKYIVKSTMAYNFTQMISVCVVKLLQLLFQNPLFWTTLYICTCIFAVVATPIYRSPELVVSMKSNTTKYLGGWEVNTIEAISTDLLTRMSVFTSQIFCSALDFSYSQRVVYKTVTNQIVYTQATDGVVLFYQVGAGLALGSVPS